MKKLSVILFLAFVAALALGAQPKPSGLRTDLIERTDIVYTGGYPTGLTLPQTGLTKGEYQFAAIAAPRPRLSWVVPTVSLGPKSPLSSELAVATDVLQTAYQIRFYRFDPMKAQAPAKGAKQYEYPMPELSKTLVWDSGKVESRQSTAVAYGGPALDPDTVYGWEVKTWLNTGTECGWSELKLFKTALELREDAISIEPLVKEAQLFTHLITQKDGVLFVDFGRLRAAARDLHSGGSLYRRPAPGRAAQGRARGPRTFRDLPLSSHRVATASRYAYLHA